MADLATLWSIGGVPLLTLLIIGSWSAALVVCETMALLMVLPRPDEKLPVLGALATVAPLVGLLGTVMGLVQIFAADVAPDAVAGGIAQALLTTQVGLLIAVPTLIARQTLLRWRERRHGGTAP